MFNQQATDLYITVGLPPVMRVKGTFMALEGDRLSPDAAQKLVYSFLTDEQKETFEREWELDLSFGLLGLPKVVDEIVGMPKGLVLVCGATGCGKSTTLASMINWINEHEHLHILTIEDPIEFIHPHKSSS